jgi:hypothetical protein
MAARTPQQEAVVKAVLNGEPTHLLITACAGAGKTATLVAAACALVALKKPARIVAFNKDVQRDIAARVGDKLLVQTLSALCRGALVAAFPSKTWTGSCPSDASPIRDALKELDVVRLAGARTSDGELARKRRALAATLARGAFYAYRKGQEPASPATLEDAKMEMAARVARLRSGGGACMADFCWLAAELQAPVPMLPGTTLFVDEAQDLDGFLMRVLYGMRNTVRLVLVGDPLQTIYEFRGANREAFTRFARDLGCVQLFLSRSFRCPLDVVSLANGVAGGGGEAPMESASSASGTVCVLSGDLGSESVPPGAVVLCPLNAPLASVYRALAACKAETLRVPLLRGKTWSAPQARAPQARTPGYGDREEEEYFPWSAHLGEEEWRNATRPSRGDSIELSTVHAFKGREAAHVVLLLPEAGRRAGQRALSVEQRALLYVAVTRASDTLSILQLGHNPAYSSFLESAKAYANDVHEPPPKRHPPTDIRSFFARA